MPGSTLIFPTGINERMFMHHLAADHVPSCTSQTIHSRQMWQAHFAGVLHWRAHSRLLLPPLG